MNSLKSAILALTALVFGTSAANAAIVDNLTANGAFSVGIGTNSGYSTSVSSISTGVWHQVALTWKENVPGSGSGDVTAFFDGQAVFGTTYAGLTSLGHYLAIGSSFFPSAGGG